MLRSQGSALPSAPPIHTASFVLQDYMPAGVVGIVVVCFAIAIVVVTVRRKDVR